MGAACDGVLSPTAEQRSRHPRRRSGHPSPRHSRSGDSHVGTRGGDAKLRGPRPGPVSDDLALVRWYLETRGEEAFRALYRAHTPSLYALALRLTGGDQSEAEDLVQESWVRAVRSLSTFRAESALRSWLCGLLANVRR